MKKIFTLLTMLLLGIGSMWATDVTWESKSGWTQASSGKASLNWFGALTPGTTDMEYTLDDFQIMHEIKNSNTQDCYIAIATAYSTSTLSTSNVVAVSTNKILPTAVQLYTYNFNETVTLKGGTIYYIVFLTSNTPTNGAYTVGQGRVALNHTSYGTYTPGCSASGSGTWWPYYKTTLTTEDPLTEYNYTCKNLAGYDLGVSGVYSQSSAPTIEQAPIITGYTCSGINVDGTNVTYSYALTTNPLSTLTTAAENIESNPTYIVLASIVSRNETSTFYYYAESDGAVKGDYNQSTKEDAAHWVIVGNETNGYKLYNARFGSAKVAQATSENNQPITMVDAASNDGTLFDLRYISGAYRFFYKGTAFCTNRLSSTSKVVGIHTNLNAGSVTSIFPYYTNALYKQSDINTAKTYTIKSGARGYLFVNSNNYVANNFSSTAESAAADANYQWAFVQAANGKYYLYNVGKAKFVGTLSTDGGRATVSNVSTTDYVYLTSTKSTSYYPLYLTGTGYNTSTYADVSAKYINTQGTSGDNNNVVYNSYSTLDGGNDFLISELNDFSSDNITAAKVALDYQVGALPAEFTNAAKNAVQSAPAQLYTIKGKLGTLEANSDDTYLTNTGKTNNTVDPTTDTKQQWALIYVADNSYLLYNVGTEKYLSSDDTNNYALVADRASASAIQFRASTTGGSGSTAGLMLNYPTGVGIGSAWLNLNNDVAEYTYGTTNYNQSNDINNMFRIEPIDGVSLKTITYNLIWNDETIATKNNVICYGSTPISPWDAPAYCSFSYDVETIETTTTEVNVTMTWDGPFDISADFASAIWYYMKSNNTWVFYDSSDESKLPVVSTIDEAKEKGDAALWAFVGDPYNGVQVVNKAKGSGYYIDVNDKVVMVTSGYTVTQIANEGANGFSLSNTGYSFGSNSAKLILLYSNNTGRFLTVRSYYCQQALDDLADYAEANAVGQYFGVRQESIDAVQGIFESMPNMSQTDYETYAVPEGVAMYLNIKKPTTGYYRIKNNGTGNYLAYGTPTANGNTRPAGLIATSNNTDAASIIKLTGSAGTYKLSVQGLNIQSQTSGNVAFPGSDAEGVDFVFNVSTPGVVSITNAASASATVSYRDGSLHEGTDGWTVHGVINWSASNPNSKWVVEDATGFDVAMNGPVDGNYYATLCVPFDVTISDDDATAYTLAKSESGNYLVPTEVTDNKVPAGTPVLLKGTNATATATINTDSAFGSPLTCALTGTYVAKTIDGSNDYVFGKNKDGKVGFYHVNNNAFSLKANRAYLEATTDQARGFVLNFDDEATGIVAPTADTAGETTIYNLSGQRLNKVQKGINIVNGKKVLF